ncbi:MAG: hypothetical protein IJ685_01165, partial [Selenomonadaceae bacterium]|nr:hypothetical protein [Selenomonadaceae bacterium]
MQHTGVATAEKGIESSNQYKNMCPQNKRRKELGIQVHCWENNQDYFFAGDKSRYLRGNSSEEFMDNIRSFVGDGILGRSERMKLLRRAKAFLARRSFADLSDDCKPKLYGAKNKIETVLDCFPSVKHSYSSFLPSRVVVRNHGLPEEKFRRAGELRFIDVSCAPDGSSKKARLSDLSRSANIRLDPMDAPRQLFIYRCRIRRCLSWGYAQGLVPVMMTLTVFHRWHPLKKLLRVISGAWDHCFSSGRPATLRMNRMGVQAYIRRLEETITSGVDSGGYNSGWHPHYHVILFVPADKVSVLSDMEDELRAAWFDSVNRSFIREFGECIDSSYANSFRKHGLFFSRYSIYEDNGGSLFDGLTFSDKVDEGSYKCPIRPVDDSEYMAKIFGCDPCCLYSGDSELTSIHVKNSRIPFDLLREDTAANNDLWVEYALATKGVRCFVFSRGLEAGVQKYFDEHPDKDSVKRFVKSDKVVAQIGTSVYDLLYRTFKVEEMLKVAVRGYEALCSWFRVFYLELGFALDDITDDMMPFPPSTYTPFGTDFDYLSFYQSYASTQTASTQTASTQTASTQTASTQTASTQTASTQTAS